MLIFQTALFTAACIYFTEYFCKDSEFGMALYFVSPAAADSG
jgi:hypothetical protein